MRLTNEEGTEAQLIPREAAGAYSLRCLFRAGEREWWRYQVLLNGVPQRLVRSAGPGWVRVFTADQRGFVKAAEQLDDIPTRLELGDVEVRPSRRRETCPVLKLAEQVTGWQAEAARGSVGRMLPAQRVDGPWMVLEVTAIYPALGMAKAVVVVAECEESEAREICADYNADLLAA